MTKAAPRQDRIKGSEDLTLVIKAKPLAAKIFDFSSTGMAILVNSWDQPGKIEGEIALGDLKIAHVELDWIRNETMGSMVKACFESRSSLIPAKTIMAFIEANLHYNLVRQSVLSYKDIPSKYQTEVHLFSETLKQLERQMIDHFETKRSTVLSQQVEYEDAYIRCVALSLYESVDKVLDAFAEVSNSLDKQLIKKCISYFKQNVPHFYESPIAERCFIKPLGYAGDFEMMNLIYDPKPKGSSYISKVIDIVCTEHPHSQSVRNRKIYLKKKIVELCRSRPNEKLQILSVASGPAEEVKLALEELSQSDLDRISFHLLDQDTESLKYAQMNLLNVAFSLNKRPSITLHNMGIKHLFKNKLDHTYHFIYSAGLFDYLDDSIALFTASKLYNLLKPNSDLLLGNFDFNARNKMSMDLLFDWSLIYRSGNDLLDLFKSICSDISIESEDTGINLFARIRKTSDR